MSKIRTITITLSYDDDATIDSVNNALDFLVGEIDSKIRTDYTKAGFELWGRFEGMNLAPAFTHNVRRNRTLSERLEVEHH